MHDEDSRDTAPSPVAVADADAVVPTSIPLGPSTSLDLSWLPEQDRKLLLQDYTKGLLDISLKAQELHVVVAALKSALEGLADTTKDVSETDNAITISHTQETSVGRTEVIMGNTQQAQRGRLTRSQTGERDWTPYYIIGGLVVAAIVAVRIFGG